LSVRDGDTKRPRERAVSLARLIKRLFVFHRPAVKHILRGFSPIVSGRARFNSSPFYARDCALADRPSSYFGIDRCLRINDTIDSFHSRVFHVAAFSTSVRSDGSAQHPAADDRFAGLQRETISQFFRLLDALDISRSRLTASYFGGAEFAGKGDGRSRALKGRFYFPADAVSARALRRGGIAAEEIPTIANFDIAPFEGALVGPRVDIYCDGVEVATLVFNYFRIRRGALVPINFVGGYGIGVERLLSLLSSGDFVTVVPRYR